MNDENVDSTLRYNSNMISLTEDELVYKEAYFDFMHGIENDEPVYLNHSDFVEYFNCRYKDYGVKLFIKDTFQHNDKKVGCQQKLPLNLYFESLDENEVKLFRSKTVIKISINFVDFLYSEINTKFDIEYNSSLNKKAVYENFNLPENYNKFDNMSIFDISQDDKFVTSLSAFADNSDFHIISPIMIGHTSLATSLYDLEFATKYQVRYNTDQSKRISLITFMNSVYNTKFAWKQQNMLNKQKFEPLQTQQKTTNNNSGVTMTMVLDKLNDVNQILENITSDSKLSNNNIPIEINCFRKMFDDNKEVKEDDANSALTDMQSMTDFTLNCEFEGEDFVFKNCFHDMCDDSFIQFIENEGKDVLEDKVTFHDLNSVIITMLEKILFKSIGVKLGKTKRKQLLKDAMSILRLGFNGDKNDITSRTGVIGKSMWIDEPENVDNKKNTGRYFDILYNLRRMKCFGVPVPILADKNNIKKLQNFHCNDMVKMKLFYRYKWIDFDGKEQNTTEYFPAYSYLVGTTSTGTSNNSTSQISLSRSDNKRKGDNGQIVSPDTQSQKKQKDNNIDVAMDADVIE